MNQFAIGKVERAACIVGAKTYHEPHGVGPRLAVEIAEVADFKPRLFANLAAYTFLKAFARFYKPSHKPVERTTKILGLHKECFPPILNQHDNCRLYRRPYFFAA